MSKIYKKGVGEIREYTLRDIVQFETEVERRKKAEFTPDREKSQAEFIPGGFDFDYEGGLRRDEILKRTTDEVEEMKRVAREEAVGIRQTAEKQGYDEGFAKGEKEGLEKAAPVMEAFKDLVNELTEVRKKFYENAEGEMINLVIGVARTVIGEDMERNPALVRNVIRAAVQKLKSHEEISIKVNPEDLAEAERYRPELAKSVEDIEKVTFRADPLITRGGCVVESNIGSIDARLETQLEAIRESFLRALDEEKAENGEKSGNENDYEG